MNVNDSLFGFRVVESRPIPEIDATMWRMVYESCGTELVYLERADENKSFAISFKTLPTDDTGVFHIIEHSVLCGSAKYPSKDPFVELLKGSMQTFLNAMTFNDKTMYPVSSRNERDFLNLVDVYMDAVLHPAILSKKEIFLQEGWHYEIAEDGSLSYKGVVFNEMKGAYSSVDEVMSEEIMKALYPDVCYGKDSGGDPRYIPDLTYEDFLAAHAKYYHPSNARIFLDGAINIELVLERLSSFLAPYERLSLPEENLFQPPVTGECRRGTYELAENESEEGKVRAALGFVAARFDEPMKILALSCITDALASTNEAPLKKALLEGGLCEDASLSLIDGIAEPALVLEIRNTTEENLETLIDRAMSVFAEAVEEGIDKTRLTAALNSMEFRLAERDYGSLPKGLVFAITAMESWLYGGDPMQNIALGETLASLREKLSTNYYEELLCSVVLENDHMGSVVLTPSKTLAAERLADERARLDAARAAMSDADMDALRSECDALLAWQNTEDTPEILATLPTLSLDDIPKTVEPLPLEVKSMCDTKVLCHELSTSGIDYLTLRFNANDISPAQYSSLALLTSLLRNLPTERHSALELESEISTYLGAMSFGVDVYPTDKSGENLALYLTASVSALSKNREHVLDLLPEVLYETLFDDKEQIHNLVRQQKLSLEESFTRGGHQAAIARAMAYINPGDTVAEFLGGLEYLKWLKDFEENFDLRFDSEREILEDLLHRLVDRERLVLSATGECDEDFLTDLLWCFPAVGIAPPESFPFPSMGNLREGIRIPSQVSYAVRVGQEAAPIDGAFMVARNILSFEYLWNEVRVKGGAYGGGFVARRGGTVAFYSYRDPSASRSLDIYSESGAFLRAFAEGCEKIPDKFIIGAVGAQDPLRTPRQMGLQSDVNYFVGFTYEDECALRERMLTTTPADLIAIADRLDAINSEDVVCVVGASEKLDAYLAKGQIDTVIDL